MKKILVLTSTYPRSVGSAEPRFVADLCRELSADNNVFVLTQNRPGTSTRETADGHTIIRYRYAPSSLEVLSEDGGLVGSLRKSPIRLLLLPFFLFAQWLAIRKTIKTLSPDIIHAHWIIPQSFVALLALPRRHKRRIPIICTSHGGDLYGLQDPLSTAIKKWVCRRVDRLCVVSEAMRECAAGLSEMSPDEIPICPMGADLETRFTPLKTERTPGQILFAGRLVRKKGLEHLVKAMPSIVESCPDANLVIVGDGPERDRIATLTKTLGIAERINFLGRLPHEQLVQYYRTASVAVFPFVRAADGDMEGLGLVVVEAMGCECPVVAGDVPAVRDLIKDGSTGFLCNPDNPDSLSSAVVKTLQQKAEVHEIANNARRFVLDNYSWRIAADRYRQIFHSVLLPQQPTNSEVST